MRARFRCLIRARGLGTRVTLDLMDFKVGLRGRVSHGSVRIRVTWDDGAGSG